jgi:hypothetical protein
MKTRIIIYDLNYASNDDYEELYELLESYKAEKLTESTYYIKTNEDYNIFKNKFYQATQMGNIIKVIVCTKKGLEVWNIRN